jgi:hypothetical protein
VDKVPVEMKSKFEEVAEEKALVLHDNLEIRDRLVLKETAVKCDVIRVKNDFRAQIEKRYR